MAADFWAGYLSGAVGILVGNPLDIIKTQLQAGGGSSRNPPTQVLDTASATTSTTTHQQPQTRHWSSLARGTAAPILGYGALNALLFLTYNRTLPTDPTALNFFASGALGGLAIFFVSAPTELIKCRAQVIQPPRSSWEITRDLWREHGRLRGLYLGGGVTSMRDAIGYGFYFWSYELTKRAWVHESDSSNQHAMKILLCGGLAGVVTWASVFPLDVIKTRVQTWDLLSHHHEQRAPIVQATQPLLRPDQVAQPNTFQIARQAYATEGLSVFFRGLGVCSLRAFIVNAVQWAVYEYTMTLLTQKEKETSQ